VPAVTRPVSELSHRRLRLIVSAAAVILAAALALWVEHDLVAPPQGDLRSFNPVEVAHLETGMWRAYYEHHPLPLFRELTRLLRKEYRMPFWRSCLAAYRASRAAVVFQRGHNRTEYELALPDLIAYYTIIRNESSGAFNVDEAARLELEWWIIHRERGNQPSGELETALAALQSEIYQLPARQFAEHANARAQAMLLRDGRAAEITRGDWTRVDQLLVLSWTSLHSRVNAAR
jgi:hypothetical protein